MGSHGLWPTSMIDQRRYMLAPKQWPKDKYVRDL